MAPLAPIVVVPDRAPLLSVAVPSVREPPVTAPLAVMAAALVMLLLPQSTEPVPMGTSITEALEPPFAATAVRVLSTMRMPALDATSFCVTTPCP